MESNKTALIDYCKGLLMGVCFIIPGVSGGTAAIILGIYEKIVNAISSILKNFVKSFLILLPVFLGIVTSFLVLVIPMELALQYCMLLIVSLFAGLIIGSLPDIFKEVEGPKLTKSNLIAFIIPLIITAALGILSIFFRSNDYVDMLFKNKPIELYIFSIFIGFIASSALVVPGISGSMCLLVLGFYSPTLATIHEVMSQIKNIFEGGFDGTSFLSCLGILGCFAVGIIFGFYFVSKFMNYALNKHKNATYSAILGFIIGSLISLFFNNEMFDYLKANFNYIELVFSILIFVGGIIFSLLFAIKAKKFLNSDIH